MTLAEYLDKNNIRREDFAKEIGVSQAYISMLCHRKHDPSLSVIMRIKDATKDAVLAEDLVSLKTAALLITPIEAPSPAPITQDREVVSG